MCQARVRLKTLRYLPLILTLSAVSDCLLQTCKRGNVRTITRHLEMPHCALICYFPCFICCFLSSGFGFRFICFLMGMTLRNRQIGFKTAIRFWCGVAIGTFRHQRCTSLCSCMHALCALTAHCIQHSAPALHLVPAARVPFPSFAPQCSIPVPSFALPFRSPLM